MAGWPDRPSGGTSGSGLGPDGVDDDADATVRHFLIADVRGYTRFTQMHGDEAAAALAGRFAAVTRDVVTAHQGVLVELRGDEALVVFSSARRAIRAAMALQDRCVEATLADPKVPLTVGIGLDSGEAVEVEGGYRGGALNLAARLCSAAGPGQVLASQEIVHLARAVTGLRYRSRGKMTFKGIAIPVSVMEVLPAIDDPTRARQFAEAVRLSQPVPPRKRRRRLIAAAAGVALVVATVLVPLVAPGESPLAVAADSVAVVDANDLKVLASVPVGSRPDGIAAGYGSVWTVNESAGSVSRLDAKTRRLVQTVAVGRSPRAVATGSTGVWVTNNADRSVSWINPRTNTVVKTIPVGNAPTGVAVGHGSVWVTNSLDDAVSVIDPVSGAVVATIPVGRRPTGIAVGAEDVWVTNSGDASVSRIVVSTRSVTDTVAVGSGPEGVAVGAGGVWVTNTLDDTVTHIDPTDNHVVAAIPAGKGPGGVAVTSRGIWVTSEYGGTLTQIDPASDQVAATLELGAGPRGVVSVRDALWVTAAGSPAVHRGGTLRVLLPFWIESIDPQVDFTFSAWGGLTAVYDGLVTYRRVGGPDGGTLVPDLATALPKPSDGGTTYRFHVRRGIRYSNGTPVRASDFQRGLRRVFTVDGYYAEVLRPYFSGIVGADACIKKPKSCRLSGVVADDAAATVTIHLTEPDGAFLNKLALTNSAAVPAGTPDHDVGTRPIPATGPYMIRDYVPHQHLLLVRNPRFREWSHAAQPDGFPNRIWVGWTGSEAATTEILKGQADFAPVPDSRVDELSTRHPDQLHLDNSPYVYYVMLDTTVSPFNDRRIRRAFASAIDRDEVVARPGDTSLKAPACRMLPPTFPDYHPDCPSGSAGGSQPVPDSTAARRLVRASRTITTPITVVTPDDDVAAYLVALLKELGYRTVTSVQDNPYVPSTGSNFQVGYWGYGPDYPSPDAVYSPLMGCGAAPFNPAKVCHPSFDRAVQEARQLQVNDPAAASVAWEKVEQTALSDAAYVPVSSGLEPTLTSRRVGGYQRSAELGPLLDQMWVEPSSSPPPAGPALHPDSTLAKVAARIQLDKKPPGTVSGNVWLPVPGDGKLLRIDPAGNQVTAEIALDDPEVVAVGQGGVWVSQHDAGTVSRIDPATNKITATIRVGPGPVGIAIADDKVWVALAQKGTVVGIDPTSSKVVNTLRYAPPQSDTVAALTATSDALWVSNTTSDTVYRVDPTGARPVTSVQLRTTPGLVDNDLAAGAGGVWRTDRVAGDVIRIDPTTGRVTTTIPVRPEPTSVVVVDNAVWVYSGNDGDGVISRIDPAINKVVATASADHMDLWVGGPSLWALSTEVGVVYRVDGKKIR